MDCRIMMYMTNVEHLWYFLAKCQSEFKCKICEKDCCTRTSPIVLDDIDIKRISKFLNISAESFTDKKTINGRLEFIIKKDKPCMFYKNEGCEIYDNRPIICKAYPFMSVNLKDLKLATSCPVANEVKKLTDNTDLNIDINDDEKKRLMEWWRNEYNIKEA